MTEPCSEYRGSRCGNDLRGQTPHRGGPCGARAQPHAARTIRSITNCPTCASAARGRTTNDSLTSNKSFVISSRDRFGSAKRQFSAIRPIGPAAEVDYAIVADAEAIKTVSPFHVGPSLAENAPLTAQSCSLLDTQFQMPDTFRLREPRTDVHSGADSLLPAITHAAPS